MTRNPMCGHRRGALLCTKERGHLGVHYAMDAKGLPRHWTQDARWKPVRGGVKAKPR